VIFNVIIGKDFGLKNSVFYIRKVLTENNRFLCIFSVTVFIVNAPQTVQFNDADFHSVEILETVVRQSEVLAPRKKWIFCKVTPVSIQAFELSKVFP
jgi:hypothetical protein